MTIKACRQIVFLDTLKNLVPTLFNRIELLKIIKIKDWRKIVWIKITITPCNLNMNLLVWVLYRVIEVFFSKKCINQSLTFWQGYLPNMARVEPVISFGWTFADVRNSNRKIYCLSIRHRRSQLPLLSTCGPMYYN